MSLELPTKEEFSEFVGDDDYYLAKWTHDGSSSWNWAAFALPPFWLCFRKMYHFAIVFFSATILVSLSLDAYFIGYLGYEEIPRAYGFINIVFAVICGKFGNRWYLWHARRMINKIRNEYSNPETQSEMIRKQGGTSFRMVLIFTAIFVLVSFSAIKIDQIIVTKVRMLNPKTAESFYNRGGSYLDKGRYDKAILNYNKAIELNPSLDVAYINRGLSYARKGQYDEAILDYTKAVELNPGYAKAYLNRGITYVDKDQYDKAILDYNRAIELKPNYGSAYNSRSIAYFYKKEYDKAWDDIYKAQNLGYTTHPNFLKDLRQASGRDK